MMGAVEISRRDKAQIALLLGALAAMLLAPAVVLAGLISGRWAGLALGVPTFPVVALWSMARLRVKGDTAISVGWAAGAAVGLLLHITSGGQAVVAIAATLTVGAVDAWRTGPRVMRDAHRVDGARFRPELPESVARIVGVAELATLAPPGGLITWAICGRFAGFALGAVTFAIVALRWNPRGKTGSYGGTITAWVGCALVGVLLRVVPAGWVLVPLGVMAIDSAVDLLRARSKARAERALEILAGRG